jgi:arabinosyltransferase
MLEVVPEEEFGAGIVWREYSFLENPRLPQNVKESVLTIDVCGSEADCGSQAAVQDASSVYLKANLTDEQLKVTLKVLRGN